MSYEIKNKIFNIIHGYPIEEYLMWIILVITVLICFGGLFCRDSYSRETYQFIKKL